MMVMVWLHLTSVQRRVQCSVMEQNGVTLGPWGLEWKGCRVFWNPLARETTLLSKCRTAGINQDCSWQVVYMGTLPLTPWFLAGDLFKGSPAIGSGDDPCPLPFGDHAGNVPSPGLPRERWARHPPRRKKEVRPSPLANPSDLGSTGWVWVSSLW